MKSLPRASEPVFGECLDIPGEENPDQFFDEFLRVADMLLNTAREHGITAVFSAHQWDPLGKSQVAEALFVGDPLAAYALADNLKETIR